MALQTQIGNVGYDTKIDDIVVPERMRVKVPIGIPFLDDCYGGQGATPGTLTLFTGTPGAGKSTLVLQMAEAISRQPNCMALVNTTEESLFQTKMVSERLFGDNGGKFYVGESSLVDGQNPQLHANTKALFKAGKARSILGQARRLLEKHPDKQLFLFIDSLQTIDDGYYKDGYTNSMTPVRALELLINFCKQTFTIIVLIGQVNKSGEFAGKQTIKHDVDCHMHLKIDTSDKSETCGMRILEMEKNRYGYSGQAYVLNVDDTGLHEFGTLNKDTP